MSILPPAPGWEPCARHFWRALQTWFLGSKEVLMILLVVKLCLWLAMLCLRSTAFFKLSAEEGGESASPCQWLNSQWSGCAYRQGSERPASQLHRVVDGGKAEVLSARSIQALPCWSRPLYHWLLAVWRAESCSSGYFSSASMGSSSSIWPSLDAASEPPSLPSVSGKSIRPFAQKQIFVIFTLL